MIVYAWPADQFRTVNSAFYVAPHSRGFESPLSLASLHERLAERWVAEIDLARMTEATQRELQGFLSQLDGPTGRVLLGPRRAGGYAVARGIVGGDPAGASVPFSDDATFDDGATFAEGGDAGVVTATAAVGADAITVGGLPASAAVIERGDVFQIGDPWGLWPCQLLEASAPARSNASGVARIAIRPRLRAAYGAGAPVRFDDPRGLFRLVDDGQGGVRRAAFVATHALRFVEAY